MFDSGEYWVYFKFLVFALVLSDILCDLGHSGRSFPNSNQLFMRVPVRIKDNTFLSVQVTSINRDPIPELGDGAVEIQRGLPDLLDCLLGLCFCCLYSTSHLLQV